MFVSKRRIILKTCGTTTPLLCLKSLLHLVQRYAGYDEVQVRLIPTSLIPTLIVVKLDVYCRQIRKSLCFSLIQDLFYSRKNYKRPELQQEPHRTFADEATLLDAMFHGECAECCFPRECRRWQVSYFSSCESRLLSYATHYHVVTIDRTSVRGYVDCAFARACTNPSPTSAATNRILSTWVGPISKLKSQEGQNPYKIAFQKQKKVPFYCAGLIISLT